MKTFHIKHKGKEYFVRAKDSISAVEKTKGRIAIFDAKVGPSTKVFLNQYTGLSYTEIEALGKEEAAQKVAEIKEKQGKQLEMNTNAEQEGASSDWVSQRIKQIQEEVNTDKEKREREWQERKLEAKRLQAENIQKEKEFRNKLNSINIDKGCKSYGTWKEIENLEKDLEETYKTFREEWVDSHDYLYFNERVSYGEKIDRITSRLEELYKEDISAEEINDNIDEISAQIKFLAKETNPKLRKDDLIEEYRKERLYYMYLNKAVWEKEQQDEKEYLEFLKEEHRKLVEEESKRIDKDEEE